MTLDIENERLRRLLNGAIENAAKHEAADHLHQVVLEEMHHRVKNMLATVGAIALQSIRHADSLEDARRAVENRLGALGRVHDLLLRTTWTGARLLDLVRGASEPFVAAGNGRFVIRGADVEVHADAALPLVMTLNELCTNAVKYGALSNPNGSVTITSNIDREEKKIRLVWVEQGGPPVQAPIRRGFGTRLIERSFADQLGSAPLLKFEPTGVVCEILIPIFDPQIQLSA